ncbi:MAG: nucleoside triphosphate diphosphatase, partial [Pseudonocardiales bacterium]|nr:nucleoside triphosphate diphosphatase [Pseudonocardiales bacterium]
MDYTVVVLSARRPDVLTATAVRALREASAVMADTTVPDDVRDALGAAPLKGEPPPGSVLLTTDPDRTADALPAAPAGVALLDAVAVMDRLRSPGGCPWDAEQTHASLLQYLVEE